MRAPTRLARILLLHVATVVPRVLQAAMHKCTVIAFLAVAALAACKGKDKPADKAGADKAGAPASGAPSTPPAGDVVGFEKFGTDRMTGQDMAAIYPAGKTFTLKAVLKEDPTCERDCTVVLSDGDATYSMFSLDASNKPKLDGKKAGAEVRLTCTPVYEGGTMQFAKSCNLQ